MNATDSNGLGHELGMFSQFLFSKPANNYIFFLPPYNSKIDPTSYLALHTFASDGRRMLSFAHFDELRQRHRKGIDVHPFQPWVITAISVQEPDTEPFGEIIIWNLSTGACVQKLTSGLSASEPVISADGKTMVTQDPHIAVFRFD